MEERITKEELLERLFHDDYENLKGKRLRLTRDLDKSFLLHMFLHQVTSRYMRILRYISEFTKERTIREMPSVWSGLHPGRLL